MKKKLFPASNADSLNCVCHNSLLCRVDILKNFETKRDFCKFKKYIKKPFGELIKKKKNKLMCMHSHTVEKPSNAWSSFLLD